MHKLIEVFYLDKTIKKADPNELPKLKGKLLWVDVTNLTKEESGLLKDAFDLHPLTQEDLYKSGVRIKVEQFPHYLFCVFYGIRNSKEFELIELDSIIGDNFLITNHKKVMISTSYLKSNYDKLESLFKKGPDFIFHSVMDQETENFFPILQHLDDQITDIEQKIFARLSPNQLEDVMKLKRKIIHIKKFTTNQREKISFLAKSEYMHISKKVIPYFRDVYDHSIHISDSIDNYREAIGNTFEVYMLTVSNKMNEVMKVLSMIATIALPLTVISSIYGTNFRNLPGSGLAYGFWIMVLLMIAVSGFMIYFFKKRQWF